MNASVIDTTRAGASNELAAWRPPPLDRLLDAPGMRVLIDLHGRASVLRCAREELAEMRLRLSQGAVDLGPFDPTRFEHDCADRLAQASAPLLRPVFNLTGTVLHTNLGRAVLSEEAIAAATAVMRQPGNLEYDLASGSRGDRDDHIEGLLRELTGAAAATAVNNNAAAVFLVLNTLVQKKEVPACASWSKSAAPFASPT